MNLKAPVPPPLPPFPPLPPPIQRKIPDWKRLEGMNCKQKNSVAVFWRFQETGIYKYATYYASHRSPPITVQEKCTFPQRVKGGEGGIKDINYSGGTDMYIPHF